MLTGMANFSCLQGMNESHKFGEQGFVTDFTRFLNSQNIYLSCRKPRNNGPFLLKIAILEQYNC